ncbi:MAG: HIT domain-containing protein [Actinobacteria bacterium]|nr:MAG: HIT domain-containing protein [Actinomycetota bacterium]
MERLWTPWRMAYIKGDHRVKGCFLCELPALDPSNDPDSLILARGALSFVILNKFPYNSGHLLVAPYRHVPNYEDIAVEEHAEMSVLTGRCIQALDKEYSPQGFNIGLNQGTAAGAGVPDHVHSHVVPRWGGDTNYMTTVGETKVLPEALEETYTKLRPHLSE